MDSYPFKHVRRVATIAPGLVLAAAVLWIGILGIHRSLWLDEAWVANSITLNFLSGMFWGGEWLQTTSPVFLLLTRIAIDLFGVSTATFRAIPLVFSILAMAAMWVAARRIAPTFAPIATAALMLPALAIEYFTSFKQYGAEAAAAVVVLWATFAYLQSPGRGRFILLIGALVGLLPLAYPLAFIAPGVVIAVYLVGGWRRAAILANSFLAMLGALYFYFIRPNVAPRLWQYWNSGFSDAYSWGVWLLVVFGLMLAIRAAWNRNYAPLVCLLPCLLLILAERSGLYPASTRMRLFIRPCALLAAAMFAEEFFGRRRWRWLQPLAAVVAIIWSISAASKYRPFSMEDYISTVAYLRQHLAPDDLLLVHPNAREGMRLYAAIDHWDLPAIYGDTGWPCCPRNRPMNNSMLSASDAIAEVRNDLAHMIPRDFHGRVFLVYANRWLHWRYLGIHAGDIWRGTLLAQGCVWLDQVTPENIVIVSFDCSARN